MRQVTRPDRRGLHSCDPSHPHGPPCRSPEPDTPSDTSAVRRRWRGSAGCPAILYLDRICMAQAVVADPGRTRALEHRDQLRADGVHARLRALRGAGRAVGRPVGPRSVLTSHRRLVVGVHRTHRGGDGARHADPRPVPVRGGGGRGVPERREGDGPLVPGRRARPGPGRDARVRAARRGRRPAGGGLPDRGGGLAVGVRRLRARSAWRGRSASGGGSATTRPTTAA